MYSLRKLVLGSRPLTHACTNARANGRANARANGLLPAPRHPGPSLTDLLPNMAITQARLSRIYSLWKIVLGPPPFGAVNKEQKEAVEKELRLRAKALSSLASFLRRSPDNAGPVIKQLNSRELAPNVSLLSQCREKLPDLMSASFRASFLCFRTGLYDLLGALPNSVLQVPCRPCARAHPFIPAGTQHGGW